MVFDVIPPSEDFYTFTGLREGEQAYKYDLETVTHKNDEGTEVIYMGKDKTHSTRGRQKAES